MSDNFRKIFSVKNLTVFTGEYNFPFHVFIPYYKLKSVNLVTGYKMELIISPKASIFIRISSVHR